MLLYCGSATQVKWSTSECKVLGTGENGKLNGQHRIEKICRTHILPNTAPLKLKLIDCHDINSDRIDSQLEVTYKDHVVQLPDEFRADQVKVCC